MTHPIPIWDGAPPGFDPAHDAPEPTITPYLAERAGPGAAVIVFPGGGYTNKEIASQLGLSVKTVETYKARSMEKLGLRSRVDIVQAASERGWLGGG